MSKKPSAGDTARKALWLILAALILAAGINLLHPQRIPWIEDWANRVEAQAVAEKIPLLQLSDMIHALRDGSRLFVDARSAEEYARAHLPGAVSLPFQTVDQHADGVAAVLSSDTPPVIYCSGPECDDSLLLALYLREQGRADVAVFVGGAELWKSEMLAVETGDEQ